MCFNYGPIFMLPLFSVVLENLEYSRLFDFIETKKKKEFHFQRRKSTEDEVLDLYTNILQVIEKKKKTRSCIFWYFAKIFETVNHEKLLSKLEHYFIRGTPITWFKSYLSDRGNKLWKLYSLSQSFKQSLENSEKEIHQTLCYSLYM